jgi:predicted nucleic acid-binding Zn ribbon protein
LTTDAQPVSSNTPSVSLCRVCRKEIPEGALKCTECGSFQNWRRIFSFSTEILALLIALFSVLGIVLPEIAKWLNRHSHTQVRIVGASQDDLLVIVMNTGRQLSTVQFQASFMNVPMSDADLFPFDPGELLILAESSHVVHLRPLQFKPIPGSNRVAVINALPRGTLKLIANIKESNQAEMSHQAVEHQTESLSPWIKTYIPVIE